MSIRTMETQIINTERLPKDHAYVIPVLWPYVHVNCKKGLRSESMPIIGESICRQHNGSSAHAVLQLHFYCAFDCPECALL